MWRLPSRPPSLGCLLCRRLGQLLGRHAAAELLPGRSERGLRPCEEERLRGGDDHDLEQVPPRHPLGEKGPERVVHQELGVVPLRVGDEHEPLAAAVLVEQGQESVEQGTRVVKRTSWPASKLASCQASFRYTRSPSKRYNRCFSEAARPVQRGSGLSRAAPFRPGVPGSASYRPWPPWAALVALASTETSETQEALEAWRPRRPWRPSSRFL